MGENIMNEELYQEHILDHYKHPRCKKVLDKYSFSSHDLNPLCGDTLTFYVLVGENRVVEQIGFEGKGCAISQASASIVGEYLQGKIVEEFEQLNPQKVLALLGITISHTRMKCAMLALNVLQKGYGEYSRPSTKVQGKQSEVMIS